jgi:hypothetical protein
MPSPISKMTFFTVGPVGPDPLALGNPATKSATTIKQAIVEIFKKFFFISTHLLSPFIVYRKSVLIQN